MKSTALSRLRKGYLFIIGGMRLESITVFGPRWKHTHQKLRFFMALLLAPD